MSTYLFSNVWHQANVIDLRIGDMNNIQKMGDRVVYADMMLKPESLVTFPQTKQFPDCKICKVLQLEE